MIDPEFVQPALQVLTSVLAALAGSYKLFGSLMSRTKEIERLEKERDDNINGFLRRNLSLTRSEVYEGSAEMADQAEKKGKIKIGIRSKSIPSVMYLETFLEKLSKNTKDAIELVFEDAGVNEALSKYFHKTYVFGEYERKSTSPKLLEDQITQDAIDFKRALWSKLSVNIGYSSYFKDAYNEGFTDEDAVTLCRKIMNFMLSQHSISKVKIKQEQKFFRFKKGSRK